MDGGKCIMQLRGVRPFFSNKFDITKHDRYRELSGYDQKNTFDIEGYVKHLQHMKVDAGRYGFVELKYYKPPHGFEDAITFIDSIALFEDLWEEWLNTKLLVLQRK